VWSSDHITTYVGAGRGLTASVVQGTVLGLLTFWSNTLGSCGVPPEVKSLWRDVLTGWGGPSNLSV
jgi:hypothetical protein